MSILELRILPPLAIARLGSSPHPLENFELKETEGGLGFRQVVPAETLYVNDETGEIEKAYTPEKIVFKDADQIRPVAPFLEVYARTSADRLEPLTLDLLHANQLEPESVQWTVEVGNIKAFRRTDDEDDKAIVKVTFSDHFIHRLDATACNFLPDKVLPLGNVRYIKPTDRFREIRLRFTPAHGLVYGASDKRIEVDGQDPVLDKVVKGRVIYDGQKQTQKWLGWFDKGRPNDTNPGEIYAGFTRVIDKVAHHISWGYLDDECDGIVTVELKLRDGTKLSAFARIGAGPPHFAPDGLPVRTIHDELQQASLGPDVLPADARLLDAEDIVRRAFETVRLMNTTVMNGNTVGGRTAAASMMPSQDSNDTRRLFAPIMGASIVDNRSVLALHQALFTALRAGTAPWFVDALRKPDEIGDLSDAGRRKMPAMMRGADARYLTLTRRQIDTIRQVAATAPFKQLPARAAPVHTTTLDPRNVTAQLAHLGRSNPPVSHPQSAISNCFPGLEFDFRNIWRRMFVGVVLTEFNNYVVKEEDPRYNDLVGRRLLAINNTAVMVPASGPTIPGRGSNSLGQVAFMEWSNTFALIQGKQGQFVSCVFTEDEAPDEVLLDKTVKTKTRELEVRRIFEHITFSGQSEPLPVLARALAQPGELTQSLCSPWQNDFRECACYYWAASRPDFVNVVPMEDGTSRGTMWMQKDRAAEYVLDNPRNDERVFNYDDLFQEWEKVLQFEIGGKDAVEAVQHHTAPRTEPKGDA
jgi:hypothetical protein